MFKKSFSAVGILGLIGSTMTHAIGSSVTIVDPLVQPQLRYNEDKSELRASSGSIIEPYDTHGVAAYTDEGGVFYRDGKKKVVGRERHPSISSDELLSRIKAHYPKFYEELLSRYTNVKDNDDDPDNFSESSAADDKDNAVDPNDFPKSSAAYRAGQFFDYPFRKYKLGAIFEIVNKAERDVGESIKLFGPCGHYDDTNSDANNNSPTGSKLSYADYALIGGAIAFLTWLTTKTARWFGSSSSTKDEDSIQDQPEDEDVEF